MKRYNIRAIMDFADIPEDKIDACLADFRDCIKLFRVIKADATQGKWADKINAMGFEWIDDGKTGLAGYFVEARSEQAESEAK